MSKLFSFFRDSFKIVAGIAFLFILFACSSAPNGISPNVTPQQAVQIVTEACLATAPTVAAVPGALQTANDQSKAQAANITSYYNSACGSAAAIQAVVAANPGGANATATWIAALGAGLTAALPAVLQATGAVKQ